MSPTTRTSKYRNDKLFKLRSKIVKSYLGKNIAQTYENVLSNSNYVKTMKKDKVALYRSIITINLQKQNQNNDDIALLTYIKKHMITKLCGDDPAPAYVEYIMSERTPNDVIYIAIEDIMPYKNKAELVTRINNERNINYPYNFLNNIINGVLVGKFVYDENRTPKYAYIDIICGRGFGELLKGAFLKNAKSKKFNTVKLSSLNLPFGRYAKTGWIINMRRLTRKQNGKSKTLKNYAKRAENIEKLYQVMNIKPPKASEFNSPNAFETAEKKFSKKVKKAKKFFATFTANYCTSLNMCPMIMKI